MSFTDALIEFAASVRGARLANPAIAGEGTALELLIAPRFQALLERLLPEVSAAPLSVLPEYRLGGVGRPDLAFAQPAQPARAFIELKEPNKSIEPGQLRGHDADQFRRFCELPLWALTNGVSIRLYRRDALEARADLVPLEALNPETRADRAEALIRDVNYEGFGRILTMLAMAEQPTPRDAREVAEVLAHAARLVREIVEALCEEGLDPVMDDVRAEFNQTLFARAEAGGYDPTNADALFASAFAQTLVFGLLLAREAGGGVDVTETAYTLLPELTYPLLRGTLRALTLDEVRTALGVAFDIVRDAVNSVDPDTLVPRNGRDPMLYLYEDFLRVFDPTAVAQFGVYYTPPEVVKFIVAETDRALRDGLGSDGLLDPAVNLLDPACGTGTFLIGAASLVAEQAAARYGEGLVGQEISAFAQRMHGFELLVGPYTVAHYRMLRAVLGHNGTAERLPIYLTDTLAPPAGAAGVAAHLAFMGAPMVAEREAADRVKNSERILAILGNPPYKRLRSGEVERLVGADMARRWDDLKAPVREAGFGLSLNAFPDLYVAFYRWAMWRLFEAEGAEGRGVLAFVTNRNFLTGRGFGGLRQMLRRRFDNIRVIDLRGEQSGARPATVTADGGVFNIKVGVCVVVAYATGEKAEGDEAIVEYGDVWRSGAFTRAEKLALLERAAVDAPAIQTIGVSGAGLAPLKPRGFADQDWPGVNELFTFRSNGIVTYRDAFAYATSAQSISARITRWLGLSAEAAAREFKETRDRKAGPAWATQFSQEAVEAVSYRPLDRRYLYNRREFVDFPKAALQEIWGTQNVALFAPENGTGAGPAVWCHGFKPDQHAFRGSFGGWVFPLRSHAGEGEGHLLHPAVLPGLAAIHGVAVTAEQVFDAALALLSATSYTTRFAHDLEDDFAAVPFPSDAAEFQRASIIGARIRALQSLAGPVGAAFLRARIAGQAAEGAVLAIPTPANAFVADGETGAISLTADRMVRITGVSTRAWNFSVSGYSVIYRWLRARNGEPLTAAAGATLLRSALEMIGRIEELLSLFDQADSILDRAVDSALTRSELGLPERDPLGLGVEEEEA